MLSPPSRVWHRQLSCSSGGLICCPPPPGCGTGNYLAALSEFVDKMTGVEQNEGMLKQSRKKTAHLANVKIFQGNILSLPFPDQQFDGVICNQVMKNNNGF